MSNGWVFWDFSAVQFRIAVGTLTGWQQHPCAYQQTCNDILCAHLSDTRRGRFHSKSHKAYIYRGNWWLLSLTAKKTRYSHNNTLPEYNVIAFWLLASLSKSTCPHRCISITGFWFHEKRFQVNHRIDSLMKNETKETWMYHQSYLPSYFYERHWCPSAQPLVGIWQHSSRWLPPALFSIFKNRLSRRINFVHQRTSPNWNVLPKPRWTIHVLQTYTQHFYILWYEVSRNTLVMKCNSSVFFRGKIPSWYHTFRIARILPTYLISQYVTFSEHGCGPSVGCTANKWILRSMNVFE